MGTISKNLILFLPYIVPLIMCIHHYRHVNCMKLLQYLKCAGNIFKMNDRVGQHSIAVCKNTA
jgi:hypothetical protein